MNGLYCIVDGKIYLHSEAVKLCPNLSRLMDDELMYLLSVHDYVDSPIKGQPVSRRRDLACSFFFPNAKDAALLMMDLEDKETFKDALKELESIIYDSDADTLNTYEERIYQLNQAMKTATPKEFGVLIGAINKLREEVDKLKIKIEKTTVAMIQIELKGGKKLSLLEQFRRNKELFTKLHARPGS